ncbi:MAG TPA: MBL fold metallo-hydrolase [Candidatus Binatia bacterium]|nr:MBL fold metallo-hydrolase [Candidatus Binatia bacterium]
MAAVRSFGRVKVVLGERNGKYPSGNSILVEDEVTALIDPSLMVRKLRGRVTARKVDLLFNSHYHEDHGAGNSLFPDAPLHVHTLDAPALRSLDTLFAYYGMDDAATEAWKPVVVEKYFYRPRERLIELRGEEVFDFGRTRMRVVPTPGHTGGHCCFFFENEGVLFLADWDLTRFGPVYADLTSDLDATIASLRQIRTLGAKTLVSFHEAGVCQENQYEVVTRYLAVVYEREKLLLDFLAIPRTLPEIIRRRIVYRKDYDIVWIDAVEKNSMLLHLRKLTQEGRVEWDGERYVRRR